MNHMTDRALMVLAGAGLAGVVWIGVLTAVLWGAPPDDRLAALLLGLHSKNPPSLFTIQNVMCRSGRPAAGRQVNVVTRRIEAACQAPAGPTIALQPTRTPLRRAGICRREQTG